MKFSKYIWDNKLLILLYSLTVSFTGAVIYMGESADIFKSNGFYVVEVSFTLFLIYLTFDYQRKKKHCGDLKEIAFAQSLDWVNSLPSPRTEEQRLYNELIRKLYQEANYKLTEYSLKSAENLEFVTTWVHEIKTPIAASKLIIENSLNEPTESVLYSLEDELNKIEDFVQMTLFYSRSGDFAKDYVISSVSLNEVVKECIKREYSSITRKSIKLSIEKPDIRIDTDEKWLGFIIKQILDNAIKYSFQGGEIRIFTEQTEKECVLIVADFGVGIKPEDIDRVFDKNFTGFNGRRYNSSTGIGLYLSQKLARKLGLSISVISNYGEGTKVSIHMPKWNSFYQF